MKKSDRYNYVRVPRSDDEGNRTYDVGGTKLPSVTTILSRTKDQGFIRKWKAKVGEANAEIIKNLASKRGTSMHKFIEAYILGKGYEDLTTIGRQAKTMAEKVIERGLTPVEEYYGSEVTLYYPGLYAGSTDLVCIHNDMDTIVDFKQANSPKRKEWIDDYYMQIAAYAMAHDYIYGSSIEQGIIMVCTPDLYLQEFRFQGVELRQWKHKFLKRLDEYYEIMKEPKIDTRELLAEFEENKIKEDK
jgi:genome maintenance exonuclease 1